MGVGKEDISFVPMMLNFQLRLLFFKIFFFLTWTIFKIFTEFVPILLLIYVLVLVLEPQVLWDPRPRIEPAPPCVGRRGLNHWTAREVSPLIF